MLNLEKLVVYFSKKGADPEEVREAGKLVNQRFSDAVGIVDQIAPSNLIFFRASGRFYYVRLGQLVICYNAKRNKGNAEFLYNPHTGVVDFSTRLHTNHILWKKRGASKANKKAAKKYGKTREVVVDELLEVVRGGPLLGGSRSNATDSPPPADPPRASLDLDTPKAVKIESKEDLSKYRSSKKKTRKKAPPRKKKPKPKPATRSAF